MKRSIHALAAFSAAGILAASAAAQVNNPEIEANDAKLTATTANSGGAGMVLTDFITGTSISATGVGLDYFRVRTATAPLAIYRHRFVITTVGAAGHTGTIRGLNQTAGVVGATDSTVQTSSTATTPPRMNQWYGFGKGEEIFYRVTGAAATTAPYTSTLETTTVTPISGPIVPAGPVVITTVAQGHTTDTDLWLYDSTLTPLVGGGNDDESIAGGGSGATLQSRLTRTLSPGTYYLAISNFNSCNNLASPIDDDFRAGIVLDLPNAHANSSTTANANVTVSIGGTQVPAIKAAAFDVVFIQFTVQELTSPIATGSATPANNLINDGTASTLLRVAVIPADAPPSTNIGVTVNANSIDGGIITLLDNGLAPDAVQGDNIFSATLPIPAAILAGSYGLDFTALDGEGRNANGTITIGVIDAIGACCMTSGCNVMSYNDCVTAAGTFIGHNRQCTEGNGLIDGGPGGAFEDISGTGTAVTLTDDSNINVPIGFSFNFYAASFSDLFISSNGHLTFGVGSSTLGNVAIPSAGVPNNAIYPLWDDLNPGVGGSVQYQTLGTAGVDLRFIVQYTNVPQFGGPTGTSNTAQAVLFENGNIEFRYGNLDTFAAGDVTVGVENANGTVAISYDIATVRNTGVRINYVAGGDNCAPSCASDLTPCRADQDGDEDIDSDDINLFFAAFESGDSCGDQDADDDVDSDDINAFFAAFEAGGC